MWKCSSKRHNFKSHRQTFRICEHSIRDLLLEEGKNKIFHVHYLCIDHRGIVVDHFYIKSADNCTVEVVLRRYLYLYVTT